jgi:hypothetical protein
MTTHRTETFTDRHGDQVTVWLMETDERGYPFLVKTSYGGQDKSKTLATAEKKFVDCVHYHKTKKSR